MPTCEKVGNVTFCQCYGTGYPEPHIFWSKHGINETHLSTSSALNVTHDPKNDGTYYCHMNNSKGYVKAAVTVAFFGKFFQIPQRVTCKITPWGKGNYRTLTFQKKISVIYVNESPLKLMNNASYFVLKKNLFLFLRYLHFCPDFFWLFREMT